MAFDAEGIYSLLGEREAGRFKISVVEEATSTNTMLKQMARDGADEFSVLIAKRQSAGRGRLGRSFYSPDGTGLYISVLLRPALSMERAVNVTAAAAVAMCRAMEDVSKAKPGIKWVNDIFVGGKKVCGILCEASADANGDAGYVVAGAGVNVCPPEGGFPRELDAIAGALTDGFDAQLRPRLAAAFLSRLAQACGGLADMAFLEEYRSRSIAIGKRVKIMAPHETWEGVAIGIDENCRLVVRRDDGLTEALSYGEISIKL